MATEEHKSTPEEEIRCIEIRILDEEDKEVFEVTGTVSRRTAHRFLESVGYVFIPVEPPMFPRAVLPVPPGERVSCVQTHDCTDFQKKCSECAKNKAKSYFNPKNKYG